MTERPNPTMLQANLHVLSERHEALESHINSATGSAGSERVNKSEGTEHQAPGNWTAVAIRADIHHFAHTYAHMLIDDRDVKPSGSDVGDLLALIATYPGYYTNNDDPAIAHAIVDECQRLSERAKSILEPSEYRRTPIGSCYRPDCDQELAVRWKSGEGTDDERAWRLRSQPLIAKCRNGHAIDAMLYGASVNA